VTAVPAGIDELVDEPEGGLEDRVIITVELPGITAIDGVFKAVPPTVKV
jgi:hypothetical protein